MKKSVLSVLLAGVFGISLLSGCGASKSAVEKSNGKRDAAAAYDEIAYETTAANEAESDDSLDFSYEEEKRDDPGNQGSSNNPGTPGADTGKKADVSKEMLVYRCSIAIDTLEFEQSLATLKTKVEEFHGFVERENQTDGSNSNGRYILDEEDKDYYYTATIRIPSNYYDSFVSAASGIGTLRSKNSSVDNVATRYGTLKNELEIYEAEYARLLKQYENTQDEAIALEIQRELRNLSITVSDIKTQMSMLESDVAYSYITITIHKVSQKEIEKEGQQVQEEDSFGTRLSKTAKQSWKAFVGFLEDIVLFFVVGWWVILLLAIIAIVTILLCKRSIKRSKAKRDAQEAEQREKARAYQLAQEQARAENQAQIHARILAQQAAAQQQEQAVEQAKIAEQSSEVTPNSSENSTEAKEAQTKETEEN